MGGVGGGVRRVRLPETMERLKGVRVRGRVSLFVSIAYGDE